MLRLSSLVSEMLPWRPARHARMRIGTELFGASIGAMLVIPQGITFAYLAGLPPEYGIYTAIFVTLFASLFGASAMLGGPNTAVALLIGAAVAPYAGRGSPLYIDYVLLLSFLVGLLQLLIWLGRGGRYFQYLSPAAITGITAGVGVILILSSLNGILGLSTFSTAFFYEKLYILASDWHDLVNPFAFAIGAVTVVTGLLARRYKPRYAILIAMTAGYLAGLLLMGLYTQPVSEIELLGHIDVEALPFSYPQMGLEYLMVGVSMLPDVFAIALIGLAQSMVIVQHLRTTADQRINIDKEVFAQGISNTLAPFFSSFAGSGSFNRTAINQSLGVKTPLAGILSAGVVYLLMISLGPLLTYMPMAVVSGTLMLVGIGMLKRGEVVRLLAWKGELSVFVMTLFSIVFIGLQAGLAVAIVLSILTFLLAASKLTIDPIQGDGAVHLLVEGHLFYASIDQLSEQMKLRREENLVLDLSLVTFMDLSATEAIARELHSRDWARTSAGIVLKSGNLLAHLAPSLEGIPVRITQAG